MATMAEVPSKKPVVHVVFLPFWSMGHMIPLVNIAKLFAATENVYATIITTPHNALLLQDSITSDHPISVHTVPFPASEVGLPEGIETFGRTPSLEVANKLLEAFILLTKPMEQLIRNLAPDCIFSDMYYPWTGDLAAELKIPRLLFYPSNFHYESVVHNLKVYAPHERVSSDDEAFLIPFLPDEIRMTRSQIEEHMKTKTWYGERLDAIKQSECQSYGLVHHTFYEVEPAYDDYYKNVVKGNGTKVWSIGPLSPNWDVEGKKVLRKGHDIPKDQPRHATLNWLDTRKANSVLYVCFGSMVRFDGVQLTEISLALEASNQSFLWVVRENRSKDDESDDWLPIGFDERNKEKGMIVRVWAPQVEILGHPAISAFMTYCGWNSVLEAITAGVPLITWPVFAEQFYIEKLMNDVLGIGVGVGYNVWRFTSEITGLVVEKEKIEMCIRRLMGSGSEPGEGERMRRAVKDLATKAKRTVEEGGSSHNNLMSLIQEIKTCALDKNKSN